MTEKTLIEILRKYGVLNHCESKTRVIEGVKIAVNEAIEECAMKSLVLASKKDRSQSCKEVYPHTDGWKIEVDKVSILKLKVP